MSTVNNPFPYFPDAGTNGYIYIGSANQDAQTNPIVAYRDAELTAPWSQPIRTVNGYAAYQGAKAGIFLGVSEFSITVKDSNGVIVLNDNAAQRFLNYDDLTSATSIIVTARDEAEAAAGAAAVSEAGAEAARDAANASVVAAQQYYPGARDYVPRGLTSVAITAAGSGGTNGTYTCPLIGDNLSVDAYATVVVSGGAVTSVSVAAPGLYIGASPTAGLVDVSSITGLTGATLTPTIGYLKTSGEYWLTDTNPASAYLSLFQNQANSAVEIDAQFDPMSAGAAIDAANDASANRPRMLTVTSGTGAPNVITATASPTVSALAAGLKVNFRVAASNTGAVTLNVDGTGAVSLRSNSGALLTSGELNNTSLLYSATYDGSVWVLDPKRAASAALGSTNSVDFVTPQQLSSAVSRATAALTSGGTANAITATATPSLAGLSGYQVGFQATLRSTPGTNTGNVTLNIDSLGDLQFVSHSGNQLPSGALRSNIAHPFTIQSTTVARLNGPVRAISSDLTRSGAGGSTASDRYLTPADGLTLTDALVPIKQLQITESDPAYNAANPNAQVFTTNPTLVAHTRGTAGSIRFTTIPSTNAFTIDLGLGAKGVVNNEGAAIGTRLVAGVDYEFVFTSTAIRITTPVKPSAAEITARSSELRPTVTQVNTMISAVFSGITAPSVSDVSTNDWLLAGDSLTWRQGSTSLGSTGEFGSIFSGEQVYNAGYTGQTSTQIAERMNAQPVTITITGGTVPTSGAVDCTLSGSGNPLSGSGVGAQLITIDPGGLDLVGTLTRAAGTADYTFTRSTSGSTVSVPSGTAIRFDVSYGMRDRSWALRVGRNNATATSTILADIDAILLVQTDKVRRTMIETIPTFPNSSGGPESSIAGVEATNTAIIARYGLVQDGGMVLDTLAYLLDTGPFGALATVGITPTSDDLTDIAAGIPPRSLRAAYNDGHFNDDGYNALDRFRVGWILRGGFWR